MFVVTQARKFTCLVWVSENWPTGHPDHNTVKKILAYIYLVEIVKSDVKHSQSIIQLRNALSSAQDSRCLIYQPK